MKTRHQAQSRSLQLVLLSDTHELHREIEVPPGDILIHAGDFSMFSRSLRAIIDFNEWLGELPHRYKIVVPGNHESFLQTDPMSRSLLNNATVLINEGIIDVGGGLHMWGSPVTHNSGPAFCVASDDERRQIYAGIPDDTDVLITHSPPYGILDSSPGSGFHAGDRELFDVVRRVKPLIHAFGHVHGGYGIFATADTTFVNAALLGPDGDIANEPTVLRIPRR